MASARKSENTTRTSKFRHALNRRQTRLILLGIGTLAMSFLFIQRLSTVELRTRSEAPLTRGALVLQSFSWKNQDSKYAMIKPSAKELYITVEVSMKHTLPYDAWFTPAIESYVKDSTTKKHGIEMVIMDNPFDATSYKPGALATGSLAYNVPVADKNLEWCYHFSSNSQSDEDLCVPLNDYNRSKL